MDTAEPVRSQQFRDSAQDSARDTAKAASPVRDFERAKRIEPDVGRRPKNENFDRTNDRTNADTAWARCTDTSAGPPPEGVRALRTVLVVDDDERILASWKRVERGRKILTASDAITARQLASTERPDVAIVDLRLGNTSGIDLIRALKQDLPALTVVLCSGYLSVGKAVTAMRAGAQVVVVKPITPREIFRRLEQGDEEPELDDTPTLAHAEHEHIRRVLADCNGNISMAARRLGIYRSSLQRALQRLGR